jgi:two-component system nitrate/nitrite response regulator NarL
MTMRVLIIDDHALFRVGLQELLTRRDITVIDAIGDGAEGVRIAQESQPDIVLLDLRMPVMDGLSVLRRLRETGLTMPVVMLTTSTEERDLVESLRNGAQGYLIKDMEPDEVVSALHEIVQGNELPPEDPFDELTPREREILCHVAEGQSNKVIARNLGISDDANARSCATSLRGRATRSSHATSASPTAPSSCT